MHALLRDSSFEWPLLEKGMNVVEKLNMEDRKAEFKDIASAFSAFYFKGRH
jgi:hypothetical protein